MEQSVGHSETANRETWAQLARGSGSSHWEATALPHLQWTHNPGNYELAPFTWLLDHS